MKIEWIKDWQYWTIMLALGFCFIVVFIPKIEFTIVEKPDKHICECNCNFNQQEEINWTFNPDLWNFTFENIWDDRRLIHFNSSNWYDECRTCYGRFVK